MPATAGPPLQDPITQHMHRHLTTLSRAHTVGEALASLRAKPPEGRILYLYVVDADNRLCGVVPTRRLLLNPLDRPIAEIMVERILAIPHTATVLDACEFFTLHRLLAFPVVDDERRLIGLVDVELYTSELGELDTTEQLDSLFQLIGVHLEEDRQASPWRSFRQRFPWLVCNVVGGLLAAVLSWLFEDDLQRVVAVALFIPVVLSLAESVGIQSVSLALLTLRGEKVTWPVLGRKLVRELGTGVLLGLACGALVGLAGFVWLGRPQLGLCLLGGIGGGMAGAAGFGLILPYVLHLLKRDPQVAAGPIALVLADQLALLLYFGLVRALLS